MNPLLSESQERELRRFADTEPHSLDAFDTEEEKLYAIGFERARSMVKAILDGSVEPPTMAEVWDANPQFLEAAGEVLGE